ncbi:hypothetical protein PR001_g13892 [Phytophthora rubi]|uniref:Uncharacterized protein n=2 Tax=Phytophthora rubi TaxID=129364 RepID=A0A6A3LMH6_9STRA|nr:hypothetical protein PR001_g13892 [Phytophthora rubi]
MSTSLSTPRPNSTASKLSLASPLQPTTIGDLLFNASMPLDKAEACLMKFGAKQLRTECYLWQLRIVKKGVGNNDHMIGYVALLMQQKRVFAEMQTLGVDDGPVKALSAAGAKRRTRHCMIRLLNVMFSEQFAPRVHQIDCRTTRAELDTSPTQGSLAFWTDFHDPYTTLRMDLTKLVSDLPAFTKCDPGAIIPHDAAKLCDT